ncbi:hypothetical protein GOP47_0004271 [Adiantum capillus-veneris]|uniref:Uncharacterized protein n=1 Tax=Adiantum capillus-veneris TaxID=13818 RepID=A0A9D4V7K4_ADICA|nr:hypothetical protein GOP47_0004271 [Adiantum capillus-veneris]
MMVKQESRCAKNMVCSILALLLLLLKATSSTFLPTEKLARVRKLAPQLQAASELSCCTLQEILTTHLANQHLHFTRKRGHDDEEEPSSMAAKYYEEYVRKLSSRNIADQQKVAIKHAERMNYEEAQRSASARADAGFIHAEVPMKPATKLYDGGGTAYKHVHVQLMERQRETIWAEMRGPKYRVDDRRAFHADYAEAHPHPPRNN